jgi:hypothetical protein
MASTRLTQNHRSLLYALVNQIVDCPAEIKAERRAYDRAMPAACKIVETMFAPKDMEVFAKYDRAMRDGCINVQLSDGDTMQFKFATDDAPRRPSGGSYRNQIYLADERQSGLIEAWKDAAAALDTATEKKRAEYSALIEGSTYFETLLDIWPEAAQLSDRTKINLPATVNSEMMARIKADSEQRMKRMAKAA